MVPTQTHQNPACPACACKLTVKKGVRRNRLQVLQVFRCTECLHRFTGAAGKNKTYPIKIILESISTFNLGYSLTETQRVMRRRYHHEIPERTISSGCTNIVRSLRTPVSDLQAENSLGPKLSYALIPSIINRSIASSCI